MKRPYTVVLNLESEDEAWALAQFVKRLCWSHMRECAVDDDEAREIRAAIYRLQSALTDAGYAPR